MATAKKAARKRATVKRSPAPAQTHAQPVAAPAKEAVPADKASKRKPKRVRGEFSMPENDYARIGKLKATAKRAGIKVKKNELLRLGLQALQGLPAQELHDAIVALRVPRLGAGR